MPVVFVIGVIVFAAIGFVLSRCFTDMDSESARIVFIAHVAARGDIVQAHAMLAQSYDEAA